ncbi:MAG: hypothetical protein LQ338_000204 [Usnochroma carphineum]|nr:MAG: hypothetical protein LQ338_000204 [Usnochroma carphineum]
MSLLGKLRHPTGTGMERNIWPSIEPINRLLGWLVSRQTSVQQEEDYSVPVETEAKSPTDPDDAQLPLQAENASLVAQQSTLQERLGIEPSDDDLQFAGFTGRCNKAADTCYAFWAGGSLAILNSLHLIDQDALRRYLLTKTQHQIGGFGKLPGDPPGELFLYISESVVVMRQFGALM